MNADTKKTKKVDIYEEDGVVLIVGIPNSGKTTKAVELAVEQLKDDNERHLLIYSFDVPPIYLMRKVPDDVIHNTAIGRNIEFFGGTAPYEMFGTLPGKEVEGNDAIQYFALKVRDGGVGGFYKKRTYVLDMPALLKLKYVKPEEWVSLFIDRLKLIHKQDSNIKFIVTSQVARERLSPPEEIPEPLTEGGYHAVMKRLEEKVYTPKLPFTTRGKDLAAYEAWRNESNLRLALFKDDLLGAYGVSEHPLAQKAYEFAWGNGHGSGLHEVLQEFDDFSNFLVEPEVYRARLWRNGHLLRDTFHTTKDLAYRAIALYVITFFMDMLTTNSKKLAKSVKDLSEKEEWLKVVEKALPVIQKFDWSVKMQIDKLDLDVD